MKEEDLFLEEWEKGTKYQTPARAFCNSEDGCSWFMSFSGKQGRNFAILVQPSTSFKNDKSLSLKQHLLCLIYFLQLEQRLSIYFLWPQGRIVYFLQTPEGHLHLFSADQGGNFLDADQMVAPTIKAEGQSKQGSLFLCPCYAFFYTRQHTLGSIVCSDVGSCGYRFL